MPKKPRLFDGEPSTLIVPEWVTTEMIQRDPLVAWETLAFCFKGGREVPEPVRDYFIAATDGLLAILGEKPGAELPRLIAEALKLKRDQSAGGTVFAEHNRDVWRHRLYLRVRKLVEDQEGKGVETALEEIANETCIAYDTLWDIYKAERKLDKACERGVFTGPTGATYDI